MKNRDLKDILIACSDNLSGISEALGAIWLTNKDIGLRNEFLKKISTYITSDLIDSL